MIFAATEYIIHKIRPAIFWFRPQKINPLQSKLQKIWCNGYIFECPWLEIVIDRASESEARRDESVMYSPPYICTYSAVASHLTRRLQIDENPTMAVALK